MAKWKLDYAIGQMWLVGSVCAPTIFAQLCCLAAALVMMRMSAKTETWEEIWDELVREQQSSLSDPKA